MEVEIDDEHDGTINNFFLFFFFFLKPMKIICTRLSCSFLLFRIGSKWLQRYSRLLVRCLVDAPPACIRRAMGDNTGLPQETRTVSVYFRHFHHMDKRRHVRFVLDVNDMR